MERPGSENTALKLNILSLEDSPHDFEIIRELLIDAGIDLIMDRVENEREFISSLNTKKYDIILADYRLPQYDAFAALRKSVELVPDVPFIVVSGSIGEEIAIEFIKQGAVDYVLKDKPEKLPFAIKRALKEAEERESRKLVEEALKKSETKYRYLFENSINGIFRTSPEGRLLEANPTYARMFGYSNPTEMISEITNLGMQLYVHPEQRKEVVRLLAEKGSMEASEFEVIRRDGSTFWVLLGAKEVRDNNGVLLWYEGTNMDITERKRAEAALRESDELNKSLLQTIPFGMDIVDEHGNILFLNENLKRQFGSIAIGQKCWTLYCDDHSQCRNCPLLSGVSVGKTQNYETQGVFGGKTFLVSHTGMLFQGKKAILEIFQDITERKLAEFELIEAKEHAEESDRLKSAFLANMSHELRTPLNSIIGFSELMIGSDYDSAKQIEFAHIINDSGNNLLAIINDIMDISKIEAGQVEIKRTILSVNKLIGEIQKEYTLKAIEKGIELRLDPSNPQSNIVIESDETKLRQVLVNFVSNAIKFTKEGFIEIGFKTIGDFIQFHVKDTGIGISKEFHEQIFERFLQIETALSRKYGGNGLGLAISKSLVELLGGAIWLESELGQGSTFYILIPKCEKQNLENKALWTNQKAPSL